MRLEEAKRNTEKDLMSKDEERQGVCDKEGNSNIHRKNGTSRGLMQIEIPSECGGSGLVNGSGTFIPRDGDSSRPNDVDNSYLPSLDDEVAVRILARVPRSQFQNLRLVNRRYNSLIMSSELYNMRENIGITDPKVLLLASGELRWWCYEPYTGSHRELPILPSDICFSSSDKETLCVGNHLLVSGKEIEDPAIWRYELESDRWFHGPRMINPRFLFASANCGNVACVAGGISLGAGLSILNTAEKYDPKTKSWEPLPRMNRRRKLCSGFCMDRKFYVIGGQNENGDNLACGECYDFTRNAWELIPGMAEDFSSGSSQSPPLVAVVNNELYSLEASSNQLKVYLKNSNTWKELGKVPVRADIRKGWGVAFKSLGDELLIIGCVEETKTGQGMTVCTCVPNPDLDFVRWCVLQSGTDKWCSFILNCAIMMA
ncbi:F-box/kelch-repeat protein At3g27150-like isoform X1 [Ananas comosus]|uniref:F-box/kelch-repeat protein At3g27150-like isoform X1 n=1 Tax=Ananas comosus TaxID=4615 RepID=A0A6P5GRA0_ANACO|nr:F-box/kelch-repeat protein At3g27150-like isoform X1 [Ananas comosus]